MSIVIFILGATFMAGAAETAEAAKERRKREMERKAKAAKYRRAIARWT